MRHRKHVETMPTTPTSNAGADWALCNSPPNAERSRVSVNGRLPKPVIPRTIGSPPRLPASPLPRKPPNPKGTVDRNAQPEQRNASRPVQPRAHPRHLEWDRERRGRRPGVRLVEIEELRPCSPRGIPLPRAADRPHRPCRHRLAPPRTRERRAGVQRSLQCKPQSVLTNCTTTPRRSKPAGRRRIRSPSTQDPRRSKPTGALTCHRRPYNEGALDAVLARLKTSRAAYRLRHRMISCRVLPSWVRRS